jgi:hypothetical protein
MAVVEEWLRPIAEEHTRKLVAAIRAALAEDLAQFVQRPETARRDQRLLAAPRKRSAPRRRRNQ